jgi:hypothetical protein
MDYLIPVFGHSLPLRERTGRDVWRHLFEPILIESPMPTDETELCAHPMLLAMNGGSAPGVYECSNPYVQLLTHQQISGRFLVFRPVTRPLLPDGYQWVDIAELPSVALPRHVRQFFDRHSSLSAG